VAAMLLTLFYFIDRWYFARGDEARPARLDPTPDAPISVHGKLNFVALAGILIAVLASGIWRPELEINIFGAVLELQDVVRDLTLLAITWASWRFTPRRIRRAHDFEWGPIVEVAKLFAAIFLTIIPAIAILRAGQEGVMAPLVALVSDPTGVPNNALYFWLTGALSSVLDNAPTYLVFFNLAGGDPVTLMGPLSTTLTAISAGAVFMGAMTYIGNAPNFMVKSIAEKRGVKMPSFVGYLAWSTLILLPTFGVVTALFFS